jgi:hypothetical protein
MASQNVHFPYLSNGRTLTSFEWRPVIPVRVDVLALYCSYRVDGSERFSESAWTVWLAIMSFQSSDCDPPMLFRRPGKRAGATP